MPVTLRMGSVWRTQSAHIYAHLFESEHTEEMAALGAMAVPAEAANVVRLRG
jgi:hypothetical protein